MAWKKRKRQEKVAKAEQDMEKKKADFKAGRSFGVSFDFVFYQRMTLKLEIIMYFAVSHLTDKWKTF